MFGSRRTRTGLDDHKAFDSMYRDPRFPESGRVEFLFTPDPHSVRDQSSVSFAQPVETSSGGLEHWDSYENFKNLIHDFTAEESNPPVEGRVRVMHVKHTEGPLDGSLYATVTKQREEKVREERAYKSSTSHQSQSISSHVTNGSYRQPLTNGPLDHSVDSGISSPLGYTGSGQPPFLKTGSSQLSSSSFHTTTPTTSTPDMLTTQQPSRGLGNSPTKLSSGKSYDEQSQLDDILSELLGEQTLNDKALVTGNKQLSPTHGSLTTHSGNSRTVVSWETSTAGPHKSATVTKHTVGQPAPHAHTETTQTVHKEEYSYSSTMPKKSSSGSSSTSPKLPPNAFSYGSMHEARQEARRFQDTYMSRESGVKSPTPPPRDSSKGRVTSPTFRERVVNPTPIKARRAPSPVFASTTPSSPPPSKVTSVPYRVDYENEASRGYYSDSEHSLSWLQQQQAKLQARREGRTEQRSRQERQLVSELKNAQSSLQRRRAESESQERDMVDQYSRQDTDVFTMNGPSYAIRTSDERRPLGVGGRLQRSASAADSSEYRAERKYYVTGVERPPFTTHQTKYTFSVSPPKNSGESLRNKPPPAPFGRSAPTSPIVPQKSATIASQSRSKSVTRDWQSQAAYSSKLDELEKSLQTALHTTPRYEPEDRQPPAGSMGSESHFTESSFESRVQTSQRSISPGWDKKVTMDQLAPPETEEEVVSLQPIGPGLQNLEPEGSTSTLGRPARSPTPSFPIQDMVSAPAPPHITRTMEKVECHGYNQPPQMEPPHQIQPLPPQPPLQTGITETRYERQEVHNVQHPQQMMQPQPVPQPVAQQHVNRTYETHTLQSNSQQQQQQPQRSPSAQGYSTIDRNRQLSATLDRNRSHDLAETVSPFPDQDQSFESRTLERSHTLPAHASLKSTSSTQIHGETQTLDPQQHGMGTSQIQGTMDRSYSTGSAQQFQQRSPQIQGGSQTTERSYSTSVTQQQQQPFGGPQIQVGSSQTNERSYSTGSAAQFGPSATASRGHTLQSGSQTVDRSYGSSTSAQQQFSTLQQQHPPPVSMTAGGQTVERSYSATSSQQTPQYGGGQSIDRSFSGGTQTSMMDRSYSTGSGQQYSPQHVPETPPFPVSPTVPKTPYDNRGGVLLHGQTSQEAQGQVITRNQSGQSSMVQGQQMQYMQGSNTTGGTNTVTRHQSVTPGGTQIVREYHETVHREFTPGAPISQEERSRMQQQQGEFSFQQQHSGGQMGTLTVDTNMASLGHQYSPGNQSSEAGISPQLHTMTSQHSMTSQQSHTLRSQMSGGGRITPGGQSMTGQSSPSGYMGHSRKGSFSSMDGSTELTQHTPRFVRDTSKVWYKPHISRDEAITLLKDKPAGTFVVRDSNSFPGAFGLAVKVAQVPPNVQTKGGDPQTELVRHFLIEPTSKGVKLKGCSNEPVFASLAALVYQHSITPLALPCKLLLPEHEGVDVPDSAAAPVSSAQLLAHGAACNVLFLYSADMESLTGPEAVAKAAKVALTNDPSILKTTVVHFKVSSQGITLTDNKRKLFFRRHYPVASVTFCGMDPEDRKWTRNHEDTGLPMNAKIFGFVARKSGGSPDNQCHLFAELDTEQPATAIVNFVTKVMIGQGRIMKT